MRIHTELVTAAMDLYNYGDWVLTYPFQNGNELTKTVIDHGDLLWKALRDAADTLEGTATAQMPDNLVNLVNCHDEGPEVA